MVLSGIPVATAVETVHRAGEANGLAFLHSLVASGFLFMPSDHSCVEPMRTRDIAYVTRELLGTVDPSALLCIQLMLAAQKHETYWTKIESYLRGHSRAYWDVARARHEVYVRFNSEGHLCESSSPDEDASSTRVTIERLEAFIREAVPVAWIGEQGIDIVVFGGSSQEVLLHCAQLKCGSLDVEFGGGDMSKHDVADKPVNGADKTFAPVLVNFKRGLQKLVSQLQNAFPGLSFVPFTFRHFTSKRWGKQAQALLDSLVAEGGLCVHVGGRELKVKLEPTEHGAEWIRKAVPAVDRAVCDAILASR